MDIALPSFVLGYHGCDQSIVESVVSGKTQLKPSRNDYDWLGDGIYFWEHNPQRAYEFAVEMAKSPHPSRQKITIPSVVGAVINLGHCLNLLDSRHIKMVLQAHRDLIDYMDMVGSKMPKNTGGPDRVSRKLDCAVLRLLHETREHQGDRPFDSVRAALFEGGELYDDSGFAQRTHIQICVRSHTQIHGYFRPLDEKGKPIRFK